MAKLWMGLLIIVLASCRKDDSTLGIPLVDVNFTISLSDPEFSKLTVVGNWEYINGGSKGIIVYRISNEEFAAFDRHCTYDVGAVCSQVDVDLTNVRANDSDCCGSQFSIVNGTVLSGPATLSLKRYNTSFDGTILAITN